MNIYKEIKRCDMLRRAKLIKKIIARDKELELREAMLELATNTERFGDDFYEYI